MGYGESYGGDDEDDDITAEVRERIEDAAEDEPDTDSAGDDGPILTLDSDGEE